MRIHYKTLTNKAIRISFFIAIISLLIFGYTVTLKAAEIDIPANPSATDLDKKSVLQAKGILQSLRFYNKVSSDAANDSELKTALSSYYCWYSAKKQKNETLATSCQRRFTISNTRLTKKYGKPVISADILDKAKVERANDNPKDIKASILSDIEESDLSQSRQEIVTYNNAEKIDQYQYLPGADIVYKRFFGDKSEEAQDATEALASAALESGTKDKVAATPFGVSEEDLITSDAKQSTPTTNPARQQSALTANSARQQSALTANPTRQQTALTANSARQQSALTANPTRQQTALTANSARQQSATTINPTRQQSALTANSARQQSATTINPVRPSSIADSRPAAQKSVTAINIANNNNEVTRDNYFEVFFAFDSFELTESARRTIDRASKIAANTASKRVAIIGHTDTAGSNEYNNYLSYKRALAVAIYMRAKNLGLVFDKIEGQGESQLAVYTANGVANAKNRRSEIHLK